MSDVPKVRIVPFAADAGSTTVAAEPGVKLSPISSTVASLGTAPAFPAFDPLTTDAYDIVGACSAPGIETRPTRLTDMRTVGRPASEYVEKPRRLSLPPDAG
jgi:hypothetical protein